jgi:hypothetical protein
VLLAAVISATTNISYRPALMANRLMEGSSRYCWVHLRQYQKLLAAAPLTTNNPSSLTLSTSILPLVTASQWEALGTPSFLLTKPLVTTGCSASRIFPVPQFLWLSVSSGQMLVLQLGVSGVIVTPTFLGQRFGNISLTMSPTLLLQQRVISHLTASWNLTGRLWSTWPIFPHGKTNALIVLALPNCSLCLYDECHSWQVWWQAGFSISSC